ncbi:hypothetical protein C0416_01790 [bacterium]|nr:hypothetical protein [bacterium]
MENCYQVLLQYALRLIARKRYTERELNKKLVAKKVGDINDIASVIARLKELKYVDDGSFATDYISTRTKISPRGKQMLKMELRMKGVSHSFIADAIEKANIDEESLAKKVITKYEKRYVGLEKHKKKEKIMRLLISKGFKPDTIYKILDKC